MTTACCILPSVLLLSLGFANPAGAGEPAVAISASRAAREIAPSTVCTNVLLRSEVPVGGQTVEYPLDKDLLYYVAHPGLLAPGGTTEKMDGLLLSHDRGTTWRVLSRQFNFRTLFVHPLDGRLYAIIDYEWQETGKDGYLQHCFANKIVVSEDGHRWKDITRGPGYVATLLDVFQDPEHPNRVCVSASVIRLSVLQYTDDAYSNWEWIHGSSWGESHPKSPPSAQGPGGKP